MLDTKVVMTQQELAKEYEALEYDESEESESELCGPECSELSSASGS